MTDLSRAIAVKPIIKYPREAQVGKTYLMTIDLQPEEEFEWQYEEEEEYPIYCSVDSNLFSSRPIGEPVVVLHRFGGSYGEAKFLLTAILEAAEGEIMIALVNKWGVPTKAFKLAGIRTKGDNYLEEMLDTSTSNTTLKSDIGIGERINKVIENRKLLISKLRLVHNHLSNLLQASNNLNQRYENMRDLEVERIEKTNFAQLETHIHEELDQIGRLIQKWSRDYLNIAVLGHMGQGKSTFLRSLCGLSNYEIPSLSDGAYTAVRSNIFYHTGETEATVRFHSEQSFLEEVIAPYYEHLSLGLPPSTLDEFASSLPTLHQKYQSAKDKAIYNHLLNDYHLTLQFYRPLLHKVSRAYQISFQDIPNYVAQERDSQYRLTNFNHLVVREIDIFCQFEHLKLSRIAFVDMPGLGDTRLGTETVILKTLYDNVDVVLFIKRPDAMRYMWTHSDFELYDLATQGLHNLQRRAFMILNHQTSHGDNLEACRRMMQSLRGMRFAGCEIVDCSKAEETSRVFDKVVMYLEENIVSLDTEFAQFTQDRLIEFSQALNEVLQNSSITLQTFADETQQLLTLSDAKNFIIFKENTLS